MKKDIKKIIFVLLTVLFSSCSPTKHSKEERLAKLQAEEIILTDQLKENVQTNRWHILKEKTIKELKDNPPATNHQLEISKNLQNDLLQAQNRLSEGHLNAQTELNQILHRIQKEGGFKAKTSEQARESLGKWIRLLQNFQQQHKLEGHSR
jgi:hypothetical protein